MCELEPPEEFQERWQEYLALVDDAVSRFHDFSDDLEGASPEEITRLADRSVPTSKSWKAAGTRSSASSASTSASTSDRLARAHGCPGAHSKKPDRCAGN
jgi:hypothetical protein